MPTQSKFRSFMAGVQAELPLLLGVFPFGMIYGILALEAGLTPAVAQAMSSIVFAGSSQFVAAQLFSANAPGLVIILTIAVVNLRHALYSASVAPYTRHLSPLWKTLTAYLLTDEAFAVGILHYQCQDEHRPIPVTAHWYYLGAGIALWSTWQLSTAAGIFLGAQVPASWPLDFTLPLTFIALMVPALKDRPAVAAALAAGATALLAYSMPFKLGLITAALVGIGVGILMEVRR